MKKKLIISICILCVFITGIVFSVSVLQNAKVATVKVAANQEIAGNLGQIEYREIELNNTNCKYYLNEQTQTVQIEEYKGTEDCVIVPEEIDGHSVESIDIESFSDCYNLETIKVPKQIAEKLGDIPDFEIKEDTEEYVIYTTTRVYSEAYKGYLELTDQERATVGVIPNKYDVPIEKIYSEEMQELYEVGSDGNELDSYDLRDYINIKVENQREYGNCYAYASFSAVETNLSLLKNENIDLSEVHAAVMTTGYGGYLFTTSTDYYASKIGPVYEEDYAMDDIYGNTTDSNYKLIDSYLRGGTLTTNQLQKIKTYVTQTSPVKYITETINFPSITRSMKSDPTQQENIEIVRNVIKEHIKTYGGIATCVAMSGHQNYNGYQVMNNTTSTNTDHGVTIVGWDDNFSKDNFPVSSRPSKDGAYLVLNSWGESWGDDGYFWISYEDKFVEANLVGVVSVEEVAENISSGSMVVTDVETNEIVLNSDIEKGSKVKIEIPVTVNNLTSGENLTVALRNIQSDFTNQITITGQKIVDKKANLVINIDTSIFQGGQYILEITYGNETISKFIEIVTDFKFAINGDGTITITAYTGRDKDVVVPMEYEGYRVSRIGEYAFLGTNIESIAISEGTTSIEPYAFSGCGDLKSITLPDGLETIGVRAFNQCVSLEELIMPNSITTLGEYAFSECTALKNITISENITFIDIGTFLACSSLEEITFPKSVKEIKSGAFQKCIGLRFVKIPRNLTTIGDVVFYGCTNLQLAVMFKETTTIGQAIFYECPNILMGCEATSYAITYAKNHAYPYYTLSNYTISYDANAKDDIVENMPEPQDKLEYDDLIISDKIPTRLGYEFVGWTKTKGSSEVDYFPGDVCDDNLDLTLYGVWKDDENVERVDVTTFAFEDLVVTYDGTAKTIESFGQDDEVIDIKYIVEPINDSTLTDGKAVDAGSYKITAQYNLKDKINYIFKDGLNERTALLTIEKATHNVSHITFESATFVYNGVEQKIEIKGDLPEGVTVSYENNKATDAGEYLATAKFIVEDTKNYHLINDKKATLKITQAQGKIEIRNQEKLNKVYDGKVVNDPEYQKTGVGNVTIQYFEGVVATGEPLAEKPVNAGYYTVKLILEETNNYTGAMAEATFKIEKATYDMSKVSFEDVTYVYDGTEKTIEISGDLPEGVTVSYENNIGIDAGTYSATAMFTIPDPRNYNEIPNKTATLIIEKATYDMSKVLFESATYVYDGIEKKIVISGELPEGVTVSYENNTGIDVGTYFATAKFTIPDPRNYNEIPNKTALLTIEKATYDMSKVLFQDATYIYDGTEKKIEVSGELPAGVTVSYENNTATDAGRYTATVKFIIPDPKNYNEIPDRTAILLIKKATHDMSRISFKSATYIYDGTEKKIEISGQLPAGVTVSYENNTATDAGTYLATAKFTVEDEKNYNKIPDKTATLKIIQAQGSITITNKDSFSKVYDGNPVVEPTFARTGTGNVIIEYYEIEEVNGTKEENLLDYAPINAGKYLVKVMLEETNNYSQAVDTAKFEIEKATHDMSKVSFENATYEYDGTEKTIEISGDLPEGVTVSYENNTGIDAGKYFATAKFTVEDERNYNLIPDMTATLEITPAQGKVTIIDKGALNKVYDGLPVEEPAYEKIGDGEVTVEFYEIKMSSNGTEEEVLMTEPPIEVGKYIVKLILSETVNYIGAIDETGFEISKATHDMSKVLFEDVTYIYDGTEKKIEISGELPEGVTVSYENNTAIDVGEYLAVAKFTVEDTRNYNDIPNKTATLRITKKPGKVTITNKESLNKVYDGMPVIEPTFEKIGDGEVTIEFYTAELISNNFVAKDLLTSAPTNAGKYIVKAILSESVNYSGAMEEVPFEIEKATHDMSKVSFENATYVYDGTEKKIEISGELPEGVTVSYENNTGIEVGTYNAVARFINPDSENYNDIPDKTAILKIEKIKGSITITNVNKFNKVYDGIAIETPTYEKNSDGDVTIEYYENVVLPENLTTETPVNAGKYIVRVVLHESKNYTGATAEAVFEISKATYDMSKVVFEGATYVYDGTEKKIEISGELPAGVTVDYENNIAVNAGEYTAIAKFINPDPRNYNEIPNKTALLTIEKATHDMSKVVFEGATYVYDGTEKSIEISGELPEGVTVSYENNTCIDAGEYLVTANFILEDPVNYNEIPSMTAKLKITPAEGKISITNKEALNKVYDGNPVQEPICNRIGNGEVAIEYYEGEMLEENLMSEAPVNVGTYTVKVILKKSSNYSEATDEATFEITKATLDMNKILFEDVTYGYNGKEQKIEIKGQLPKGIKVSYENNTAIDVGEYLATAHFIVEDTRNYNEVPSRTAILKIVQGQGNIVVTNKAALSKVYDGKTIIEPIYEKTGEGKVSIEYFEGEEIKPGMISTVPINVAVYTARFTLEETRNYTSAETLVRFEITKATHDMSKVSFEDVTYIYDGTEKRVEITGDLPEGVTVSYENNTGVDVGEYIATAKFTVADLRNYNEIENMIATLRITKQQGKVTITNKEALNKVYDGMPVVEPEYEKNGDGEVIIEYFTTQTTSTGIEAKDLLTSAPIEVGKYIVRVTVAGTNNYSEAKDESTFEITKATYDMSNIVFEDATYEYDGTEKKIEISGELPAGVTVNYKNNIGINAGKYNAIARFINPDPRNYNEIPNKTALLTIEKATHDMGKVLFEDVTYVYDGTEKKVEITGDLPEGVIVSYENNTYIDAGEYLAKANFIVEDAVNYNQIPSMTATLKITPAEGKISIINKETLNKVYDGNPVQEPTYEKTGIGEVVIEYYEGEILEENLMSEAPVNVGTYTVKVILKESNNYNEATDEATFEITKATLDIDKILFEDVTYKYDGTEKKVEISGDLPEGIKVSYENNTAIDVGEYLATANFIVEDSRNYNEVPSKTAILTIEQGQGNIVVTNKEALNKVYDGKTIIEPIYEKTGEGKVKIEYFEGEEIRAGMISTIPINVGIYTARFTLEETRNYTSAETFVRFEITKATHDMSKVLFEDVTYVYDGAEKKVEITGDLPEGVTVSYENNTGVDVGEYIATAKFTVADIRNYNEIENMVATLTITKQEGKVTITNKEALNKVYDGLAVIEPTYEKNTEGKVTIEYYVAEETSEVIEVKDLLTSAPIEVGKYIVKVIVAGTNNYSEAIDEAVFEISKATYDMSNIAFEDTTYVYDGTEKKIEITGDLPEGVTVSYENNTATDVGEYTAIAKFTHSNKNYNEIENKTAILKITPLEGNIVITNKEALNKIYDGNSVEEPTYIKVGDGEVKIEYYTAEVTDIGVEQKELMTGAPVNAGTYIVKVILEKSNNYLQATDEAVFEISKATYDMSKVLFEDVTYVYDGTEKKVEITGELPEGVTVSYENNTAVNAGEYLATAKFVVEDFINYNEIENMTATLKITRQEGKVTITNKEALNKVYDGLAVIEPTYEKTGDGEVTIEYYTVEQTSEGYEAKDLMTTAPIETGTYIVKVIVAETNNYTNAKDEAVFEITKATHDMSKVLFEDITCEYDGTEKKVEITGELPEGVTVSYENNTGVDVGEYIATAKFTVVDLRNYNEIENMVATLTITKQEGKVTITNKEALNKVYDGLAVIEPTYEKNTDGEVRIEYYVAEETSEGIEVKDLLTSAPIEAGKYIVRVIVAGTNNYSEAIDEVVFEISKATYDMSNIIFEDATYEYDGTEKKIEITGELPEGVTVSYENNTASKIGEYLAIAKFTVEDPKNYNLIEDMTAVLTIKKISGRIEITNEELLSKEYDGNPAIEPLYEKNRDGEVKIEYYETKTTEEGNQIRELVETAPIDVGTYVVKVILLETIDYSETSDEASFEITKTNVDMSKVLFEDVTYKYDGTEKKIEITGELPEGVTVSYENNTGVDVGEYIATAKFTILDTRNYNEIEDKTAILNIIQAQGNITILDKESLNKEYDGLSIKEIICEKTGDGEVIAQYYNNVGDLMTEPPVDAGDYAVRVILKETKYYSEATDEATFKIRKANYNMSEVSFKDTTYEYDGTEKKIEITGELPEGVTVSYENNIATEIGEYTAIAKFTVLDTQNYNEIPDMTAVLKIVEELELDFGEYEVVEEDGVSYLEYLEENLTVKELKEKFSQVKVDIYDNGELLVDEEKVIGTGMRIVITKHENSSEYQAVIRGDITGDGYVTDADLLMLARYMLKYEKEQNLVKEAKLKATDVYEDNELATDKDLLKLARMLLK